MSSGCSSNRLMVRDLIDVPALAYTLYGTNSPYNYCEEYKWVSCVRCHG